MKRRSLLLATLTVLLGLVVAAPVLAETTKARVLKVDEKKSEVRVDVAGAGRTYHIDDRSLYRVLVPGRLVIITAELVSGRHTIVEAKPASQRGRVTELDERAGSVVIQEDGGGSATYYFDAGVSSRGLRQGDAITFDVEERGKRNVITRWTRGGGGGSGSGGGSSNRPQVETLRDSGRVYGVDKQRKQITIELASNRRRQTFEVSDRRLLDEIRTDDRVAIEYERRSYGLPLIVSIK